MTHVFLAAILTLSTMFSTSSHAFDQSQAEEILTLDQVEKIEKIQTEIKELKKKIKTQKLKKTGAIVLLVSTPLVFVYSFVNGLGSLFLSSFSKDGPGKLTENLLALGFLGSPVVAASSGVYIYLNAKDLEKFNKKLTRLEVKLEQIKNLNSLY